MVSGHLGVDLQNDGVAGLEAGALPHVGEAQLKIAVVIHGADAGNKGVPGTIFCHKDAIVTDVCRNKGDISLGLADHQLTAIEKSGKADMAVHGGVGNALKITGMALDAVHFLHIRCNFMEIAEDHIGLIAVTGKAYPGIGVDGLQAVFHRALLFVV